MEKKYPQRVSVNLRDTAYPSCSTIELHYAHEGDLIYLSLEEHDAIVKGYEEKCDRLKKEIVRLQAQVIGTDKA